MSEDIKSKKKATIDISNKQFEKLLTVCLLVGIIVVGAFVVYYILTPEEGFVEFAVLHQDPNTGEWEAENYLVNTTIGQEVNFSFEVLNFLKRDLTFRVKVLTGNGSIINNKLHSPDSGAVLNTTTENYTIPHGQSWNSVKYNITFFEIGENQMIILELWEIIDDNQEKYWTHLWLRVNVTA